MIEKNSGYSIHQLFLCIPPHFFLQYLQYLLAVPSILNTYFSYLDCNDISLSVYVYYTSMKMTLICSDLPFCINTTFIQYLTLSSTTQSHNIKQIRTPCIVECYMNKHGSLPMWLMFLHFLDMSLTSCFENNPSISHFLETTLRVSLLEI